MFQETIAIEKLPPGAMTAHTIDKKTILLANVQGAIHATEPTCTHDQCDLAKGTLEGCVLECAVDHAMFDVTDGKVLGLPAITPLKTFPTKVENGVIWVDMPSETDETAA